MFHSLLYSQQSLYDVYYLTRPRGPCQVKEGKIILEQSLLAGWLAIWIVNLVSNFLGPCRTEPWNEFETSCHKWSDAHEGSRVHVESMRVGQGLQTFGARGLTYYIKLNK